MTPELYIFAQSDFERRYQREDWTWYRPLLAQCVRFGPPGAILDIGAGLGFFVECCREWGVSCTGLDGSAYAVERAQARGLDVRHCVLTQDTTLPFEDHAFSIVVLSQVLTHLPPAVARRAFAESYRVLQDGGVFLVSSISRHFPGARGEPGKLYFYTPSQLRRELESLSFSIVADLNEPRPLLGSGVVARGMMRAAYRLLRWDSLSESAGFVAARSGTDRGDRKASRPV